MTAHLAIAQVCNRLPLQAQPQADNQGADLGVVVQLGVVLALDVEDLAAQRQDGLEFPIARHLGAAACRRATGRSLRCGPHAE
jgi:hypothetical protein